MIRSRTSRWVACALPTAALVCASLVATASTADAWPWSSTVHVAGNVSCTQSLANPKVIWVNSLGQARPGHPNWRGSYGVDIQNVPGNSSHPARADILCSGPWGSYWKSHWFSIHRPGGAQLNVNFRS